MAFAPVPAQVAGCAAHNPDGLAVSAPDGRLTYVQLERRANQLAHHLIALGVTPGSRVALCLGSSAAMVVASLAVLKAGAAYVALDPSHPGERLGFVLNDCAAAAMIAPESAAERAGWSGRPVVDLTRDRAKLERHSASPPPLSVAAGDPAYIIYTSGSTGAPKGVLVSHGGLANLIAWHQSAFEITRADRATQLASPGFDAAVWELWPHLAAGASIHVPAQLTRAEPIALRDWLVAGRLTVSFVPTLLAEELMALPWPPETRLRVLLTGGEMLHRHPPEGLPFLVVNNYGPTEGTVVATSGVVPPDSGQPGPPSIGRPVGNVRTYVVDEQLAEVPPGTVGELLIGGPGVALGYVGEPALTEERFIPDRFGRAPGARLYRTGDYVRERPDGELEFHGRRDQQIQIRGNRVELGEISAALRRHPAVRTALAIAHEPESTDPRVIAYFVADEPRPEADELRRHIASWLPAYMVPPVFIGLEALPLTPSGKIDRARLPVPSVPEPAPELPEIDGELEAVLARIVAELLELPSVGARENFFMLGGHSLLGAQLVTRINALFGIEMSLRSLFDHPTVAEMADEVQGLLVADLEAMTDADAARLLAEAVAPAPTPAEAPGQTPGA